jgi:capsular polysaccharide biosynthesis protein
MAEDLTKYIQILRKRIGILLVLPIISALAAAAISLYLLEPVYKSSVSIIVINKNNDPNSLSNVTYDDLLISQQLVKDYAEIIKSRSVTSAVINQLTLNDLTPEKFARNIEVQSKNDTDIIEIKVKDKDPQRAKIIVETMTEVFQQKIYSLYENRNVKIIDTAEVPMEPDSPNIAINVVLAAFLGLAMAVIIIFLIEFLDDTIKTSEEAEKVLGLPVVGIIPNLKK